jgi:hypothetical protein
MPDTDGEKTLDFPPPGGRDGEHAWRHYEWVVGLPAEVSVRIGTHVWGKRALDRSSFRVDNAFSLQATDGGVTVRLEPFAHLLVEKRSFPRITEIDTAEGKRFCACGHYTFSITSTRQFFRCLARHPIGGADVRWFRRCSFVYGRTHGVA